MMYPWLSVVPPIIVLILGYATRRVIFSLVCGVLTAAFIATSFSPYATIVSSLRQFWINTDIAPLFSPETFWQAENAFMCLFLFMLSILVTLIGHSGGAYAYRRLAEKRFRNKTAVETSSLILSSFLIIDDYFSSLTVGSVLRSLTDRFRVPRAKLAFLVDSKAAALAVLTPISSWMATIVAALHENGVTRVIAPSTFILADPFSVYLRTLPFVFYSFIIISAAWFIVRRGISFGLMHTHERIAQQSGNLFGGKAPPLQKMRDVHQRNIAGTSMIDFFIPITILFFSVIGGILYSGGYYLLGGTHTLPETFLHIKASVGLFCGGLVALSMCTIFFLLRRKLHLHEIPSAYGEGINLLAPAILILLLSWTLGDFLRHDLQTGNYLASLLLGKISIPLLPLMFFIAAFATSFAIGSSWGTIAILFPIAIPMIMSFQGIAAPASPAQLSTLFPVLGAILSGGVVGDHISPISDTTIMSSMSTGSYHIDHVQTQMEYSIPVILGTGLAFLLVGFLIHYVSAPVSIILSLGIAIPLTLAVFQVLNNVKKQKDTQE